MEGEVIANYSVYYNKGKRCIAIVKHDGTTIKYVVGTKPD